MVDEPVDIAVAAMSSPKISPHAEKGLLLVTIIAARPDVLGHADVKTTRRYARSELEDRRAALEARDS